MKFKDILLWSLLGFVTVLILQSIKIPYGHVRLPGIPKYVYTDTTGIPLNDAIVILGDMEYPKIRNFCSGVVISQDYILTAAHCLNDDRDIMKTRDVAIMNSHGAQITTGKPVAKSDRFDLALLLGEFGTFHAAPLRAHDLLDSNHAFIACGFPAGQPEIVCERLENVIPFGFKYAAGGQYVPGMSGGPVFEVDTDAGIILGVVGVNYAVSEEIPNRGPVNVIFSPVTGMLGMFDIY